MFRTALVILALAALAVTVSAATVEVNPVNYAGLGWTKTLINGGLEAGQSCDFRNDPSAGIHPSPKKSGNNQLSWAGIGIDLPENRLSSITTFRIRVRGYEGDGGAWEPPSVYLQVSKEGTNARNIRFLPYASYGRSGVGSYAEYDLIGPNAKWFCHIDAAVRTWAQVLAAWPLAQLDSTVTTPLPGGKNFNIMDGCAINQEVQYGSSARGTVDWVEIAFDGGELVRYDFVPEPGSILVLATGLLGVIGLRRKV